MVQAIEAAKPDSKHAARVTKSALARLRVDQLRGLLEQLGGEWTEGRPWYEGSGAAGWEWSR